MDHVMGEAGHFTLNESAPVELCVLKLGVLQEPVQEVLPRDRQGGELGSRDSDEAVVSVMSGTEAVLSQNRASSTKPPRLTTTAMSEISAQWVASHNAAPCRASP